MLIWIIPVSVNRAGLCCISAQVEPANPDRALCLNHCTSVASFDDFAITNTLKTLKQGGSVTVKGYDALENKTFVLGPPPRNDWQAFLQLAGYLPPPHPFSSQEAHVLGSRCS